MILLDTSILIALFKGTNSPAVFAIPAICMQEVLQGARNEKEWHLLEDYLFAQRIIYPGNPVQTHYNAAYIYYACRRKGITIRSTVDCIIAQQVIEEDALLMHSDTDFENIKLVTRLQTINCLE